VIEPVATGGGPGCTVGPVGTWSVKILDSDLALDAVDAWQRIWHESRDDAKATRAFVRRWSEGLRDPEDGPVVWLALAELQHGLGRLDRAVLAKGARADRVGAGARPVSRYAGRARAREGARTSGTQARRAAPKPRAVKPPPRKTPTELAVGDVVLWRTRHGNVLLWVFGLDEQSSGTCPRLELLAWIGDTPPANLDKLARPRSRRVTRPSRSSTTAGCGSSCSI